MTNRERISGVDTAWLRMDQPTNLMMIVGVMMLEGRVALRDLKRVVRTRFLGFERFRQRAVQDGGGAWWEADPAFDLDAHVVRVSLPGKGGNAQLEALVSKLASTPLDPARPLWQFHLVDNFNGGSAVVLRIHHCYADGMALVRVMLSLTGADARASLAAPRSRPAPPPASPEADFWGELIRPVGALLGSAVELGKGLVGQGMEIGAHPLAAIGNAQGAARKGLGIAGEVARLALMGADSPTRFKGALGVRKRAAWAEPLPLDEVKAVGRALGCSVNDVVLSLAAGALREYLLDKGDAVDGLEIRAIVPVNLRPPQAPVHLGNQFGLVFLELPLGLRHPLERLYEIRRRMRALKGSYQPAIALALLATVGQTPGVVQDQVTAFLAANASAVMTNVPGPQQPLYLAGKRITDMEFWVPQSGGIGMGVSILSYDGRVHFGLITDAGLVPDPKRIVGRFGDEFAKLMWLTLMSPWAAPEAAPRVPRRFRTA